jgi:hypothetical protein
MVEIIVGLLGLAANAVILKKLYEKPTPSGSLETPKTVEVETKPEEEKPPQVWLNCNCCGRASFKCVKKGKFLVCENCII